MSKKFNNKLDDEEQNLLNTFNKGKLKRVDDIAEEVTNVRLAAKNHLKKDARINIRLSQFDLNKIKRIAVFEGLPYQTLIASILHKYVNKSSNL